MQVWTQIPVGFSNVHIVEGTSSISVNANESGSTICVTSVNSSGNYFKVVHNTAQQTFTNIQNSDKPLYVTVTKHNFLPYLYTSSSSENNQYSINNVGKQSLTLPIEYDLSQNFPNPFNPETNINFSLKDDAYVELNVYNTLGQIIKTLVNSYKAAGFHTIVWDGKDNLGNSVSSGIYIYRISAGSFTSVKKMIVIQ